MNITDLGFGLFGAYLIANELKIFGDLPSFSPDYKLPIIKSEKDVEATFEQLKLKNKQIDKMYEKEINSNIISFELDNFESECFLTSLLFNNIFDFWCGHTMPIQNLLYDDELVMEFELLEMCMWDYLKDECSLNELKEKSMSFSEKYLLKLLKAGV